MRDIGEQIRRLRNTPVRELVRAIQRDGFQLGRTTRTGSHVYQHQDGRTIIVHYHSGSDTLKRKTLASVIRSAQWTTEDLRRLGLI